MSWWNPFRRRHGGNGHRAREVEAAQERELDRGFVLNESDEAMLKLVAVSYAGAVDWLHLVYEQTPPEVHGRMVPPETNDSWTLAAFDFAPPGLQTHGHPVRVHLFAHEGLGFIGQPGAAHDAVYKGAHAIVGLAQAEDAGDLAGFLDAASTRLASHNRHPHFVLAHPPDAELSTRPESRVERGGLPVDWRDRPLEPLKQALKLALTHLKSS